MLELDLMLTDSRRRIRESESRASLLSQLGNMPPLTGLPLFTRTARPLATEFVIRRETPVATTPAARAA